MWWDKSEGPVPLALVQQPSRAEEPNAYTRIPRDQRSTFVAKQVTSWAVAQVPSVALGLRLRDPSTD